MPNSNSSPILVICGTALLLAVLGGLFTLAWHGTFTSSEVFGLVTIIIGIAGGAFAVHSGVQAGGNAAALGGQAAVAAPAETPSQPVP